MTDKKEASIVTTSREERTVLGGKQPVAVEGLADQSAHASALASEGFAGVAAVVKPPEGLSAAGTGEPPKVEGFAGGSGGAAPPVDGFGESGDNRGQGKRDVGFLDQEEETQQRSKKRVAEDIGPDSGEIEGNATARAERINLEPGWEESSGEQSTASNNQDRGDDGRGEESLAKDERTRLVPYETLFKGQRHFTAQLKANGYGGFHEWRMQLMKQLMDNRT
ncbi:MAG: hypothetical protein H7835_19520 [Magnetococcus sp. XQGC-1]